MDDKPPAYIRRIKEIKAELKSLGVSVEEDRFDRMSIEELEELGRAYADQLATRKRWLEGRKPPQKK